MSDSKQLATIINKLDGIDAILKVIVQAQSATAMPQKKKKVTDPDAPKRPSSAYILFTSEEGKKLMASAEGVAATEEGIKRQTYLSKVWGEMSKKKKDKYTKQYEQNKAAYAIKAKAYNLKKASEGGAATAADDAVADEDEDEETVEVVAPKKASRKKKSAAPKKKAPVKKELDSDSDSDSSDSD